MVSICYNGFMKFDRDKFAKWINRKREAWAAGDPRANKSGFANYLGLKQQTVSRWLLGDAKERPKGESLQALIMIYGIEVYDAVNLPEPELSEDELAVVAAWRSAKESTRAKGIDFNSPEGQKILIEELRKSASNMKVE